MSFPVYLRFGPLSLHPHVVFETLAYVAGFYIFVRERRRVGDVIDTRTRLWTVAAAVLGGVIGSRLLSLLEDPAAWTRQAASAWAFGGKSIVGGLLGGVVAVEWIKKRFGVIVATGDLLALPLTLGIGIGRIGCFLTGLSDQTHGIATGLPWGVDFGDGVPRHPTQLYEILFLAALGFVLIRRGGGLGIVGDRFKLFLMAYLAFRLAADFLKPAVRFWGASAIQWACVLAVLYYARHVPRLASELADG